MSSMKEELETWVTALAHYDRNEFEEAITSFQPIADTSKIYFNCGVIRATLGEHEDAVQYYLRAIALDPFLAIAYFQAGVSNFLVGDFEEALVNFNDALKYLRGNNHIDYDQLGLKFKLYSCEVLFNRGLCYVYLQHVDTGIDDMRAAAKEKAVSDHDVIDEAITEKAEGYTVFSIPVGVVFRPSEAKVKNVRARDYLGKTQVRLVVSQQDPQHASSHRRNFSADNWALDDRPADQLSYAATHLVKSNLVSRSRQQSEPPINRNMFPPTPPPESEKPTFAPRANSSSSPIEKLSKEQRAFTEPTAASSSSSSSQRGKRSQSAGRAPKPGKLDLGVAAFEKPTAAPAEPQVRRAAARSASERPAERRRDGNERESDRRRLFGSVDGSERAEDVSSRLQREPSGPSPTFSASSRSSAGRTRRPPPAESTRSSRKIDDIHEEEEPEVVDDGPGVRSPASYGRIPIANDTPHGLQSPMRVGRLRSLRVKVHFADDTRYIIAPPATGFAAFADLVARKFDVAGAASLKLRTKDDEGDLITMADEEDFSLAVALCEAQARKDGVDVGKMEIWAQSMV